MDYIELSRKQKAWARNRAISNSLNENLTNGQHRAIALLCHYRHNFHKNMDCLYYTDSASYERYINFFLKQMPVMLHAAALPALELQHYISSFKITSLESSIAVGEQINSAIENYLKDIDYVYGTWYAPTGYSRSNYNRTA